MSEPRCFYEVLGVSREASGDEVRKAYKQAARTHHPDRNPGDDSAVARFKEITEAYQVLSDDDKRARYDRFGHAGLEMGAPPGTDPFAHAQDLFSQIFGGAAGFGRQQRRGPSRGQDLRVQQRLTFEEAFSGAKREVALRTPVACDTCQGSGAKAGTLRQPCRTCGGAGQVSISRGFVMFTQSCPDCGGEGSVVRSPCEACRGQGQVERQRKVTVTFPAGIDAGQRLRVPGQGMPAPPQGGAPGDLYVDVELQPHEHFERDGLDLLTRATLSFVDASLGVTVPVTLPDGSAVQVDLAPGTQPGDVVQVRGKGFPRVDGRGRGSLHVAVQVEVPRSLSARGRELLEELRRELEGASPREAETVR
jgi:molecular chaperone DnaJ